MGTFEGTVNEKSSPARLSLLCPSYCTFLIPCPASRLKMDFYRYWLKPHLSTMCMWILPISFPFFCLRGSLFCGEKFLSLWGQRFTRVALFLITGIGLSLLFFLRRVFIA